MRSKTFGLQRFTRNLDDLFCVARYWFPTVPTSPAAVKKKIGGGVRDFVPPRNLPLPALGLLCAHQYSGLPMHASIGVGCALYIFCSFTSSASNSCGGAPVRLLRDRDLVGDSRGRFLTPKTLPPCSDPALDFFANAQPADFSIGKVRAKQQTKNFNPALWSTFS